MAKNEQYHSPGDPADFAPDFTQNPEPYGQPVPELIAALDGLPPASKIIDIAGGYGKYAVPLANRGYHVEIVDIHQQSLDEAEHRNKTRIKGNGSITTNNADVIRGDLTDSKYDAVFCAGFVHHLDRSGIENLFDTMASLLDKGGLLVLDFSTDKDRRHPDGSRILVDGVQEQNMPYEEGVQMLEELYGRYGFTDLKLSKVKLQIRQEDFWYDANMIIASGKKLSAQE